MVNLLVCIHVELESIIEDILRLSVRNKLNEIQNQLVCLFSKLGHSSKKSYVPAPGLALRSEIMGSKI